MKATLSFDAMARMRRARPTNKAVVKEVLGTAKRVYGIPVSQRLRVEIDNQASPKFGVLIRKKTGGNYSVADATVKAHGITATPRFHLLDEAAVVNILGGGKRDKLVTTDTTIVVGKTVMSHQQAWDKLQAHLAGVMAATAGFNDLPGGDVPNTLDDSICAGRNGLRDGKSYWIPVMTPIAGL